MARSKFSTKAVLLATTIGFSTAAFAGSQPAAAQSYTCPSGLAYDPSYGCTLAGDDYGYPTILRGHLGHRGFDHAFTHGLMGGMGRGVGVDRGFSAAHFGRGGFAHGMGGAHVKSLCEKATIASTGTRRAARQDGTGS